MNRPLAIITALAALRLLWWHIFQSGTMWHLHYGSWWMVQWCCTGWVSFGVHIDFRTRLNQDHKVKYGPYIDFHFLCFILSLGRNPRFSGDLEKCVSVSRGGV